MMRYLRRGFDLILTAVTSAGRRVMEHWLLAGALRRDHRGLMVVAVGHAEASSGVFNRVSEALDLIARFDQYRFRRLQKDLRRIVVTPFTGANAAYLPGSKTCYLSTRVVEQHSALNVAMLLVHEATHARIEAAGIRQWPDQRSRFERACVRAELAFASRVSRDAYPGIEGWIEKRRGSPSLLP